MDRTGLKLFTEFLDWAGWIIFILGWMDWVLTFVWQDGLEWAGYIFIWAWTFLGVRNGENGLKMATFGLNLGQLS